MHETKIDLPTQTRQAAVKILNDRLADAMDLSTQAKQAHWNVKGPNFIALHEHFDQIHGNVIDHVDLIGERITALGGVAEGTAAVAAERSTLPRYPLDIADGRAHVDALATTVATFGNSVREAIDQTAELGDAGTADLFTEVSRGIDKHLWFLESHLQRQG